LWLDLLIVIGTCIAGILFGLFVYWIIIKIPKRQKASQSSPTEGEGLTSSTITEEIKDPLLIQPLNEGDYSQDIQRKTEDDDWLNDEVPEASESTIRKEDDDWLNAGVSPVPVNISKEEDDAWLKAEETSSMENSENPSSNGEGNDAPEIQIKQDGSVLNITVTTSNKQDLRPEQTVINLRLNVSPQNSAGKGEEPYDIEVTTDDSSPSDHSLEDIITLKPVEEPGNQSHLLMDEISVRSVENPG
jgi:hypothetical protein